jgi:hypothetical protein
LLRNRLIFLFSTLQLYSQGGMVIVLTLPLIINLLIITIHRWQRGVFWVSNPISYPHLRFWASIINGKKLSPLIFYLVSKDIRPTLSIILYILYLILAFILNLDFYFYKLIKSRLQTLYAWLRRLTFVSLALPSLLAPVLDDTNNKVISLFSLILSIFVIDFS